MNRGWSQEELGSRLTAAGAPMHQTTVAKLEAARRPITVNEVHVLAGVFGLDPRALLDPAPLVSELDESVGQWVDLLNDIAVAEARVSDWQWRHIEAATAVNAAAEAEAEARAELELLHQKRRDMDV